MLTAFLGLVFVAGLVAFGNWRMGVFAMIVVGVLQDPLRKLTAGVPSYFVLGAALVFVAVALSAFARNSLGNVNALFLGDRNLRAAWLAVLGIVTLQVLHALLRWGNPMLPALGFLVYFGPVIALLVGMAFADSETAIRRFMVGYIVLIVPACLTVYLSANYGDSVPVLQDIGATLGSQIIIYDVGTALESHPGIFRVGEIAAWHAATAASFLIILATQDRSLAFRAIAGVVIVLLIGAIVLTGRRKMLMALTIFVVSQWALLAMFRRGVGRLTITVLVLGLFGSFALALLDPTSEQALYLKRGVTVFDEAGERLGTAFDLLWSAIYRSSGIGLGAGVTAQGAQHVGGAVAAAGGAGEAGLGKIILELGIPGALAVVWLLVALAIRLFRNFGILAQTSDRLLYFSVSFVSLLVANVATFAVATQVYGDLFVLIILGFVLGMVFALNRAGIRMYQLRRLGCMEARSAVAAKDAS